MRFQSQFSGRVKQYSLSSPAYKWPLLTKGLFSYRESVNISHHACLMRCGELKLIMGNYKPSFLTVFSFRRLSVVSKGLMHEKLKDSKFLSKSSIILWYFSQCQFSHLALQVIIITVNQLFYIFYSIYLFRFQRLIESAY